MMDEKEKHKTRSIKFTCYCENQIGMFLLNYFGLKQEFYSHKSEHNTYFLVNIIFLFILFQEGI